MDGTQEETTVEEIRRYVEEGKDTLDIIIAGKLGTGKSALVNGILGKEVAVEGLSPESVTKAIELYESKLKMTHEEHGKEIKVRVWDTPGVGDPLDDNPVEQTQDKCKESDLLLYCLDMRNRFTRDDHDGMKQLTEALGPEIWKNAVITLTFANKVEPSPYSSGEFVNFFTHTFQSWCETIKKALTKLNVPVDIVEEISIVPTGYRQHPPPDRKDWFTPFWLEAFSKIKESAQPTLLGINLERFRLLSPYQDAANAVNQDTETHNMTINISHESVVKAALKGAGATTVATAGGAFVGTGIGAGVGAGIGATIGALVGVLGGPLAPATVPAGAATGAWIGAVVGAGLGSASGTVGGGITAVATIIKTYRKNQK